MNEFLLSPFPLNTESMCGNNRIGSCDNPNTFVFLFWHWIVYHCPKIQEGRFFTIIKKIGDVLKDLKRFKSPREESNERWCFSLTNYLKLTLLPFKWFLYLARLNCKLYLLVNIVISARCSWLNILKFHVVLRINNEN